ncbi:hypothetical protein GCM10027614_51130 [Micromonospora vulcania]
MPESDADPALPWRAGGGCRRTGCAGGRTTPAAQGDRELKDERRGGGDADMNRHRYAQTGGHGAEPTRAGQESDQVACIRPIRVLPLACWIRTANAFITTSCAPSRRPSSNNAPPSTASRGAQATPTASSA